MGNNKDSSFNMFDKKTRAALKTIKKSNLPVDDVKNYKKERKKSSIYPAGIGTVLLSLIALWLIGTLYSQHGNSTLIVLLEKITTFNESMQVQYNVNLTRKIDTSILNQSTPTIESNSDTLVDTHKSITNHPWFIRIWNILTDHHVTPRSETFDTSTIQQNITP